MKIDKLAPDQERDMIATRAEWLAVGRNTKPIDRHAVKKVIGDFYRECGKKEPLVFFFDSPLMCVLGREAVKMLTKANLGDNLWDNLWANLGDNLGDNLRANLGDNLGANLWDNLRANLGDNLGANLGDNLRANLGANLGDNLRANLGDNLG